MCDCAFGCSGCYENRNNLIYLLYNNKGFGYIGKTTHLHARLKLHRHKNNECGSKKLGEFKFIVLESNIESDYLSAYEQYWYDIYNEMYGGKLVNCYRPNGENMDYYERRNDLKKLDSGDFWKWLFADEIKAEQRKAYIKTSCLKNKDKLLKMKTENPEKYKIMLCEKRVEQRHRRMCKYNCNTEEEYKAYKEQQIEEKKERTKKKAREKANKKVICKICGGKYIISHKSTHFKTQKHLKIINKIEMN